MKKLQIPQEIVFVLPVLVILSSVIIALYFPLNSGLALGITADLTLTAPLLYLGIIYRRNIPKTTVVPVLILGILVGSYILPKDQQFYLNLVKNIVLPLIECVVLSFVVYKIYQARIIYQEHKQDDFYSQLLVVAQTLFPKRISYFLASELSILYYCFSSWKDVKLRTYQFSYHKKSGSTTLLWGLLMILFVEAIAVHILLALWSKMLAWVMTILTIYTFLQVISLIRSMAKRPIEMNEQMLWLKYGTFADAKVAWDDIEFVLDYDRSKRLDHALLLSPLGEMEYPNLHLKFKKSIVLTAAFGLQKECRELLLFVDEKEAFKKAIEYFKKINE